jgi:PTH1 family peptidyl-tRNA hydrolase
MISLVLGLGNIGAEYENTRHNLGFEVLDAVAQRLKADPETRTRRYRWSLIRREPTPVALAWPTLYMNRSGLAAQALLERLELAPEQMLVVVDDFNLPLGALRVRREGSDGGHYGLASIIEAIGTEKFPRLRLGIGPVPPKMAAEGFVLERFKKKELTTAKEMILAAAEAVIHSMDHRLEQVMTKYNRNPA